MRKAYIDLHTHSVLSRHAYSSLTENIEYAAQNDLLIYGISEHQPDDVNVGAHKYAFGNCARIAPKKFKDTRVLVGIELNILDGHFDTFGINMQKLAYGIASMHAYAYSPKDHDYKDNTDNYLMALNTDYVNILGHIDYPAFPFDHEKIVKEAKRCGKLIELNNASLDPDGSRKGARQIDEDILRLCMKYECPILLSSDAHIKYEIGNFDNCYDLLDELGFPEDLIINYDPDRLHDYVRF
ncbi:MAG: hypothetical protein IJI92_08185 [Erysipelotrichaceae bacterium]|nr:hypothetical protein [Erysipelotrichaceae bacterium]